MTSICESLVLRVKHLLYKLVELEHLVHGKIDLIFVLNEGPVDALETTFLYDLSVTFDGAD